MKYILFCIMLASCGRVAAAPVDSTGHIMHALQAVDNKGVLTRDVIEKLDKDKLYRIIDKMVKDNDSSPGGGEVLTAALALFGIFIFPPFAILLGLGLILFFWYRRKRALYATLNNLAEKGVQIPAELLSPPKRKRSDLRTGAILIAAGAGVTLFMFFSGVGNGAWALGLIPLFIGIGYIIIWKFERTTDRIPE